MTDWLALLTDATEDFAGLTSTADPGAPVPACPGWAVADLVDHLGGVHQWARHAVLEGNADGVSEPAPDDRALLAGWYAGHARALCTALADVGPAGPAWTFGTEQTAAWWGRRQVHETLMHTRDLLAATGQIDQWSLDPALAWDGVREVATEFQPRQVRLGRADPLPATLRLTATDLPDADPVEIGDAGPVVELAAPAETLLLVLWRRVEAPAEAAHLLRPGAVTP